MILHILMMVLVLFCIACVLFFIFYVLLPSLNAQKVNTANPLFSSDEFSYGKNADTDSLSDKVAVILCSAERNKNCKVRDYKGFADCSFYESQFDSADDCKYGCIGLGSCVKACTRNAISIVKGTAAVNLLCNGCGDCVSVCPRDLIKLVDKGSEVSACRAYDVLHAQRYDGSCPAFGAKNNKKNSLSAMPRGFSFLLKCYRLIHRV